VRQVQLNGGDLLDVVRVEDYRNSTNSAISLLGVSRLKQVVAGQPVFDVEKDIEDVEALILRSNVHKLL